MAVKACDGDCLIFGISHIYLNLSVCLSQSIVYICTESMKRSTTLLVKLCTSHLSTTKTSADKDLNTLSTHSHCSSDS